MSDTPFTTKELREFENHWRFGSTSVGEDAIDRLLLTARHGCAPEAPIPEAAPSAETASEPPRDMQMLHAVLPSHLVQIKPRRSPPPESA